MKLLMIIPTILLGIEMYVPSLALTLIAAGCLVVIFAIELFSGLTELITGAGPWVLAALLLIGAQFVFPDGIQLGGETFQYVNGTRTTSSYLPLDNWAFYALLLGMVTIAWSEFA